MIAFLSGRRLFTGSRAARAVWLVSVAGCGSSGDSDVEEPAPAESGGAGATVNTTEPEALEPGSYGQLPMLPEANSEMAVAELDGLIYVLGGYPATRVVAFSVQVYDPAAQSWGFAEPLPLALHHPVVVGTQGKLYSLGGQTADADGTDGNAATDRTLVYDPSAGGGWQDLAPMPTARGAGAAAVVADQIYVVGGRAPAANAFEVYDISDDAWTALPDLPQSFSERNHLAATAINGMVYVAGGRFNGGGFTSPITDSLDRYDPQTGVWEQLAAMPNPRGGVNGVMANGCFFVWGGEAADAGTPQNVFPDHDVYDPVTDRWTELAEVPTPIHGVTGAAFLNGLIYMPGGGIAQGGSSGSTIFQVYRPDVTCE